MEATTAGQRRHLKSLLLLIPILSLGAAPLSQAQEDDARAACGRQAKDAGVSGQGAVSAFVAECVAGMQEARDAEGHGSKRPNQEGEREKNDQTKDKEDKDEKLKKEEKSEKEKREKNKKKN